MKNLKSGLEFIFASYKRTAAILFIAALTLAIPITITLVGQQQDIRQRAETEEASSRAPPCRIPASLGVGTGYYGDVNEDGKINPADANRILQKEAGSITLTQPQIEAADVDGDPNVLSSAGNVNSIASTLILQYVAGLISTFNACPATPTATPTCMPRPACLDTEPRCLMPEPIGGWCPSPTRVGTCGDGVCQNIVCLGLNNCPVPETPINCPQDCLNTPTATPTATPTQTPIPTTTSHPSETRINLSLQLTGIGNATESARGINNNPKRPARNIDIKFFNSQDQEVLSRNGATQFDPTSGLYKGTIVLGANFQGGPYIVKVRMDNTLWKQAAGIHNIVAGQDNSIAQPLSLVTGDVNQDNEINLFDYTIFLTCYRGNCEGFPTVKIDMENLMYAFNVKRTYE